MVNGQGQLDGRPDDHHAVEDDHFVGGRARRRGWLPAAGLITAVKWSTPNIPRLLMVNVPPVNSSGLSRPARARSASARVSMAISVRLLRSVSQITGGR